MPIILFKQTHPTKKLNLRLGGDGTMRNDTCLPAGVDLSGFEEPYSDYETWVFDWEGFENGVCSQCCSKTCSNYESESLEYHGIICV